MNFTLSYNNIEFEIFLEEDAKFRPLHFKKFNQDFSEEDFNESCFYNIEIIASNDIIAQAYFIPGILFSKDKELISEELESYLDESGSLDEIVEKIAKIED